MILMTDTYENFLVPPSSCSRITGHYYLTNHMSDYYKGNPTTNETILTELNTLKTVVSYPAES